MSQKPCLRIYTPENGCCHSSFSLYLPANSGCGGAGYYTEYCFAYEVNPPDPSLRFDNGPNDPSNRRFYRIRQAFVVRREGDAFTPVFRALQAGEIGFALREEGSGDFVGGLHGDEVMTAVSLEVDGAALPLNAPYFGSFESFRFCQSSYICRCNTPSERIMEHSQVYTVDGLCLRLLQRIQWLSDALPLQNAFMPMLTAQRINPENTRQVLTDTVELYKPDGTLAACFDTSPYGTAGTGKTSGDDVLSVCKGTFATRARVYGKHSGFSAEAGYTVLDDTISAWQIHTNLCIRFMPFALDNKIYFDIGSGTQPKNGTVWKSDVFYRITYTPHQTV